MLLIFPRTILVGLQILLSILRIHNNFLSVCYIWAYSKTRFINKLICNLICKLIEAILISNLEWVLYNIDLHHC